MIQRERERDREVGAQRFLKLELVQWVGWSEMVSQQVQRSLEENQKTVVLHKQARRIVPWHLLLISEQNKKEALHHVSFFSLFSRAAVAKWLKAGESFSLPAITSFYFSSTFCKCFHDFYQYWLHFSLNVFITPGKIESATLNESN